MGNALERSWRLSENRQHPHELGTPLAAGINTDSDYRYLVSGSYMIFYRVNGNDVYVNRILYGRRDYLRILFGDTDEEEN